MSNITILEQHAHVSLSQFIGIGLINAAILYQQPFKFHIKNVLFWQSNLQKYVGMERVLGIDPGVRVFAPQYLTRKGRVLSQLWYLPVSKTILIDLKLDAW